jgi:putative transposase
MSRRLCKREGRKEHDRVQYRLHKVADSVLSFADSRKSAIVIEDLTGLRYRRNEDFNRRVSLWPRRQLRQIIEYKAACRGIPVVKVDPRYSSRKCPICGRIQDS